MFFRLEKCRIFKSLVVVTQVINSVLCLSVKHLPTREEPFLFAEGGRIRGADQRREDEERGTSEQARRPRVRGDEGEDEKRKIGKHTRRDAGQFGLFLAILQPRHGALQ